MSTRAGGAGRGRFAGRGRVWALLLVVAAAAAIALTIRSRHQQLFEAVRRATSPDNPFTPLTPAGYRANPGGAGRIRPGTLLQTQQRRPDGAMSPINPPVVVAWPERCYPELEVQHTPYALPSSASHLGAGFSLDGSSLAHWLPQLRLSDDAVTDSSLTISQPRLDSAAKIDLTDRMSSACVAEVLGAIGRGAQPDWFSVVLETISAGRLVLSVKWSHHANAQARVALTESTAEILRALAGGGGEPSAAAAVTIDAADQETTLDVTGNVVLAYRSQRLQPISRFAPGAAR